MDKLNRLAATPVDLWQLTKRGLVEGGSVNWDEFLYEKVEASFRTLGSLCGLHWKKWIEREENEDDLRKIGIKETEINV
jgi:hypothetical protein